MRGEFDRYRKIYDIHVVQKCQLIIVKYTNLEKSYKYIPYCHMVKDSALDDLFDLVMESVVFYAFSESEILKLEQNISFLDDMRSAAKYAFSQRLPKRKCADTDGTLGEVLLDLLIQVYEPMSQKLLVRGKHIEMRKKSEISGYDALYFTKQGEDISLWIGQAKAGSEQYCKSDIKMDLNKKYSADYFSDSAFYIADKSESQDLLELVNGINQICLIAQQLKLSLNEKNERHLSFLKQHKVSVKIPCLLAYTKDIYGDAKKIATEVEMVKESVYSYFDSQKFSIGFNLPYEIMFYVFPIKDVSYIRERIVDFKKEVI